jgi:hypothetical protein
VSAPSPSGGDLDPRCSLRTSSPIRSPRCWRRSSQQGARSSANHKFSILFTVIGSLHGCAKQIAVQPSRSWNRDPATVYNRGPGFAAPVGELDWWV